MKYNVVITDSGFANHHPEESVLLDVAKVFKANWESEDELIEKTRSADALLVQWAPITNRVIEALTACKIIVRYGIGYDNIDLQAATRRGIVVCNVPDYCIEEVADHTIALALSSIRQIPETDKNIRDGKWNIMLPRPIAPFSSLNFGIAGFGRIAREVAKRALGVGFQVSAHDPFVDDSVMEAAGVNPVSLADLFRTADILSLHLPLNTETKYLVNTARLQTMKRNAIILNTSRGGLIDIDSLVISLNEGAIWGAALDVFEEEPLPPSHSIRNAKGTILSSHVAWYSNRSIPILQKMAAEEIARHLSGGSVINQVNKDQ